MRKGCGMQLSQGNRRRTTGRARFDVHLQGVWREGAQVQHETLADVASGHGRASATRRDRKIREARLGEHGAEGLEAHGVGDGGGNNPVDPAALRVTGANGEIPTQVCRHASKVDAEWTEESAGFLASP